MPEQVHHPIFARVYALLSRVDPGNAEAEYRREMLAGAKGRAIEVGAGHGLNFAHYPATVTTVLAVEPETYLRGRAEQAAQAVSTSIEVRDGLEDRLPGDGASYDLGVCSLALCSVPDQAAALAELHRVIRPGGELSLLRTRNC